MTNENTQEDVQQKPLRRRFLLSAPIWTAAIAVIVQERMTNARGCATKTAAAAFFIERRFADERRYRRRFYCNAPEPWFGKYKAAGFAPVAVDIAAPHARTACNSPNASVCRYFCQPVCVRFAPQAIADEGCCMAA